MKSQTVLEPYNTTCLEELEKRAARAAATTQDTIVAGNSVVLFTMMVLHETLEQLALTPITNLSSIITISNSIASLNSSIKLDP